MWASLMDETQSVLMLSDSDQDHHHDSQSHMSQFERHGSTQTTAGTKLEFWIYFIRGTCPVR